MAFPKKFWWSSGAGLAILAGGAGSGFLLSHRDGSPGAHGSTAARETVPQIRRLPTPHNGTPIESLALSDQARQNLDLQFKTVAPVDYWRSLTIPAEVIEEPGHCEQRITTSLQGTVQKIHVLKGQTVYPGDPLFDLRLAGGPLADVQANLLRTVLNLELVKKEIERLKPLERQAVLPGTKLLEKEYERDRLEQEQHVHKQELLIRGLTEEQVAGILKTRTLLREFTVRVPMSPAHSAAPHDHQEHADDAPAQKSGVAEIRPTGLEDYTRHAHGDAYTVEQIEVVMGEMIQPGRTLCDLALHTVLLIEGHAYEREASVVERAMKEKWPVEAQFETGDSQPLVRTGLSVLSIENSLDPAGRTLKFYLPLVNEVFLDRKVDDKLSYRNWRFRPGQKVRLLLPTEFLQNRIVLPLDAVVREGADAYVFRQNGNVLERVSVVIDHQDVTNVVLGRGSQIYSGETVAFNQAYQLNLMLRQAESSHQPHDHDHDH